MVNTLVGSDFVEHTIGTRSAEDVHLQSLATKSLLLLDTLEYQEHYHRCSENATCVGGRVVALSCLRAQHYLPKRPES
jgi:hypothetical protein